MANLLDDAAAMGSLVYQMSQSDTDPLTAPGPWGAIEKGYCAGLVVRWAKLAYAGKDFPYVPADDSGTLGYFFGTDWQATVYQNKLGDHSRVASPQLDREQRADYVLGLAQMRLARDLRESGTGAANGERLTRVASKSYGCYYVSLVGDGAAHAIALRHSKPAAGESFGAIHVFDPNNGHFRWTRSVATWPTILTWFMTHSGYAGDYAKAYMIGRIVPSINHDHA